jgi:hypothetical protein
MVSGRLVVALALGVWLLVLTAAIWLMVREASP